MKKTVLVLMLGALLIAGNLYAAGDLIVDGTISLPTTTSSVGIIKQATNRFIHSYGTNNVFVGKDSGNFSLTTACNNVGLGFDTLSALTTGCYNMALGAYSLRLVTTGSFNMAIGLDALRNITYERSNVAIGVEAMSNTGGGTFPEGNFNVAIGGGALQQNLTGKRNTVIGAESMNQNYYGDFNVAIGPAALGTLTDGDSNTAIGRGAGAGSGAHTKSGGVFIGHQAGGQENNSNRLYIDNSNTTTPLIYGEFDNDLVRINGDLDVEGNVEAWGFITGDITFQKDGKKLWRMFEDENGLYLESLKTGKVYRFVLKEVEKK